MATISFSFELPDDARDGIVEDFARQHGWPDSPETPTPIGQYARSVIRRFIRESVVARRATRAAEAARRAAVDAGVEVT